MFVNFDVRESPCSGFELLVVIDFNIIASNVRRWFRRLWIRTFGLLNPVIALIAPSSGRLCLSLNKVDIYRKKIFSNNSISHFYASNFHLCFIAINPISCTY